MKTAYFAGGCFWCIAAVFDVTPGVVAVTSGYCGGTEKDPAYADVKAQKTGHRETVRVDYDETVTDFAALLQTLFAHTDPHDGAGQFIDRGRSYSLAVYYGNGVEKAIAEQAVSALEKETGLPVYVAVEPFTVFYPAEEYHQNYHKKHPREMAEEWQKSGRGPI